MKTLRERGLTAVVNGRDVHSDIPPEEVRSNLQDYPDSWCSLPGAAGLEYRSVREVCVSVSGVCVCVYEMTHLSWFELLAHHR